MTSIHTNISAVAALRTLRSINADMDRTQAQVSSGQRISAAQDNAAYWSISTTMKSDKMALSAVSDALGLGSAVIDTAYSGMTAVVDVLGAFKAKLVLAKEPGVDGAKVQAELEQLKAQVVSIAKSSSFNGVNLLDTKVPDMFDNDRNKSSLVSSFVRDPSGGVSVKSMEFSYKDMSLFNSTGGGILEKDPRNLKTMGGLRYLEYSYSDGTEVMSTYSADNRGGSQPATQDFWFSGPLTFGASDEMSFDVTVDADNPSDLPGPLDPGKITHIVIDRASVDQVLPSANGVISNYTDFTAVLSNALSKNDADAGITNYIKYVPSNQTVTWVPIIDRMGMFTLDHSGRDGASFQISNFTSTVGSGGLGDTSMSYGTRADSMTLNFDPFEVYSDAIASFNFSIDREAPKTYTFDRHYVNALLGTTDGKINTPDDMAALLNALINRPDINIVSDGVGAITVTPDPAVDRKSGSKSSIGFTAVKTNMQPTQLNFVDIDIATRPELIDAYLGYVEFVSKEAINGAAVLGSLKSRLDMQTKLTSTLMDSLTTGVGRLVDADMDESSMRLKALQTRGDLAIKALSIANAAPQTMLSLFK